MSKFLGIDTSCYTTSLAVYDSEKGLICEERIILKVKMGGRGLSQSNMVYQHVRNLPVLMQRISPSLGDVSVIGVSSFPRRRADSFMPAFLVGKGLADSLSAAVYIPMYQFSHQENHALSAIREAPELWGKDFYLMHLSGGTQDVLRCAWKQNKIEIQELITTRDITAGQLIDRIGVALGLLFPAGKHLEILAMEGKDKNYVLPMTKILNAFSFTGQENQCLHDIEGNQYNKADIAKGLLCHIGDSLEKELLNYPFEKGTPFVSIGGVMSNLYLKGLVNDICREKMLKPYFASPKYSSDNASGNAFGAFMNYSSRY